MKMKPVMVLLKTIFLKITEKTHMLELVFTEVADWR